MPNIVCTGPGPHVPASGILGTADQQVTGMLCPSTACQASNVAAQAAVVVNDSNKVAIQANIVTHLAQMETWLAANPNGAVLTAAQTKFLAQMLVGVGRVLLGLTTTIGGAT